MLDCRVMNLELLQSHWALIGGGILLVAVGSYLAFIVAGKSAYGQLRATRSSLGDAERKLSKQGRRVRKLEKKHAKLARKRESAKPRVLRELEESLEDARALQKNSA